MSLRAYLSEDGTGPYAHYYVRDLLGEDTRKLELLLILESPHTQEIRTKIPLSGSAGVAASKFLFGGKPPHEPLGLHVARRAKGRELRVGLMNVSPVPLQDLAQDAARSAQSADAPSFARVVVTGESFDRRGQPRMVALRDERAA